MSTSCGCLSRGSLKKITPSISPRVTIAPISAPKHLQDLAGWIEHGFYSDGRQKELVEQIKALDPEASIIWGSVSRLEKQLEELEETFKTKEK